MDRNYKLRTLGTHDGTFHADEVSACALLLMCDLIDREGIVRSRDPDILKKCEFICDVGGVYDPSRKMFDHHQVDYTGPMSSAGMVLLYLKDDNYISQREYDYLNGLLIRGVDDHDNGKDPQIPGVATYSHVIANFTPVPYDVEAEKFDAAFFEALDFSLGHLRRLKLRYDYMMSCRGKVEIAMQQGSDLLVFEENLPWVDLFFELGGEEHPAEFLIMPTKEHWKLRGIPPSPRDKMRVRVSLPKEWGGLLDKELKEASGIEGAIFCHKGGFISVWETREDAFKAWEHVRSRS